MTADNSSRMQMTGKLTVLKEAIDDVLTLIDSHPALVRGLHDHELLALVAFTSDDDADDQEDNEVLHAEGKRRHDEYQQQERRFAAFADQLDLIADLPPDTPWTEARRVMAERACALQLQQS
jgi:hypothetical protein